jgi:hypothetical protein
MANLSGIVDQLRKERDQVQKQLSALNAALTAFVGAYDADKSNGSNGKRAVSAAARRKMNLAQKARWAKASKLSLKPVVTPKRVMSAGVRRKIAAAQRARWARVKAKKAA